MPGAGIDGKLAAGSAEKRRKLLAQASGTTLKLIMDADRDQLLDAAGAEPEDEARAARLANKVVLMSWERAMQGAFGFGLNRFRCKRRPRPLLPWERRYFVKWEWPENHEEGRMRSCVENPRDGTRLFEVPISISNGAVDRNSFHLWIDQCSKGWYSGTYLHNSAGCRGFFFSGPVALNQKHHPGCTGN